MLAEEQIYIDTMGSLNTAKVAKRGIDVNEEVRAKLSESTRRLWREGKKKGTPKSTETRALMSAARKLYWERRNANR